MHKILQNHLVYGVSNILRSSVASTDYFVRPTVCLLHSPKGGVFFKDMLRSNLKYDTRCLRLLLHHLVQPCLFLNVCLLCIFHLFIDTPAYMGQNGKYGTKNVN